MTTEAKRVPVTILTGFLGSGKTTLLNRILDDPSHGMKFAVVENEFGEIGIDQKILSDKAQEEVVEIMNGCICCKAQHGEMVETLKRLYERVEKFDGLIIETTGIADPAPVVQTFFAENNDGDDSLERMYRLDGVITVVDAGRVVARLDEDREPGAVNEAEQQLVFADKIVLNKTDLVDEEGGLERIEARLGELNPDAPILRCRHGAVPPKELINVGSFDLERVLRLDPFFLGEFRQTRHNSDLTSISARVEGEVSRPLLDGWVRRLLKDYGDALYRYKGIIAVAGEDRKYVFQGVGDTFSGEYRGRWAEGEDRKSTFVFIGRGIDTRMLRTGFEACREERGLRFPVGTRVEVNLGMMYMRGAIAKHHDDGNAYRVRLDVGREVHAPLDIDAYVRAR